MEKTQNQNEKVQSNILIQKYSRLQYIISK